MSTMGSTEESKRRTDHGSTRSCRDSTVSSAGGGGGGSRLQRRRCTRSGAERPDGRTARRRSVPVRSVLRSILAPPVWVRVLRVPVPAAVHLPPVRSVARAVLALVGRLPPL